ncbi:hypothetical protein ACGFYQ_41765 [Streptomyces sp. NPDC048258]|uniref:hypothetical protein n=1 Tax=Streptomyces sp. NPDC048258 TaxID=3365527 RepID=UPI0037225FDA
MAPGVAEAEAVAGHPATRLTNHYSGLDASILGHCDNQPCINGKGLALLRETGNIFVMVDVPGGSQIRWFGDWCLEADSKENGTPVVLHKCDNGRVGQWWTPQISYSPRIDDGYQLVNAWSGRCLDARNPDWRRAPQPGTVLQIWDCHDWSRANQIWDIDF